MVNNMLHTLVHLDEAAREHLEAARGKPVSDEVWELLFKHDHVDKYIDESRFSNHAIKRLMEAAEDLENFAQGKAPKKKDYPLLKRPKTLNPDETDDLTTLRRIACSLLLARQAEQDERVEAFRTEVMGNELLKPSEIKDWVLTQVEREGLPKTHWVTIPVVPSPNGPIQTRWRSGNITKWEPDPSHPTPAYKAEWEPLRANIPSDDSNPDDRYDLTPTLWTPIRHDGVLGRLRDVAEHLINPRDPLKSPRYPWSKEEATTFILTNLPPIVNEVDVRFQESPTLPGATRIILTIDPTLSPAELAEQYKRVRAEVLPKRYRSLTAKHLRLAAFVSQRSEEKTWEQTRLDWHKWCEEEGYPAEYKYDDAISFSRAARDAVNHLLKLQSGSSQ